MQIIQSCSCLKEFICSKKEVGHNRIDCLNMSGLSLCFSNYRWSKLTKLTKTLPGSRPPWSSWHPSCIPSPWLATLQNCSPCTGSLSGPRGTSPPPNRSGSLTTNPTEPKNKSEAAQWITTVKLPTAHLSESFYQTDSYPKTKRGCCNKRFQRMIQ